MTNEYDYDAYGNQKNTSANDANPLRYCGEYYDEESGLIYLRNIYYDSEIGRFITEDPIQDGMNWYVYCRNNPVMFTDPCGFSWDEFDVYLPQEVKLLISKYTDNYLKSKINDVIIDNNGLEIMPENIGIIKL